MSFLLFLLSLSLALPQPAMALRGMGAEDPEVLAGLEQILTAGTEEKLEAHLQLFDFRPYYKGLKEGNVVPLRIVQMVKGRFPWSRSTEKAVFLSFLIPGNVTALLAGNGQRYPIWFGPASSASLELRFVPDGIQLRTDFQGKRYGRDFRYPEAGSLEIGVGRNPQAYADNFAVGHREASQLHLLITLSSDGSVTLEDKGSTNNTYLPVATLEALELGFLNPPAPAAPPLRLLRIPQGGQIQIPLARLKAWLSGKGASVLPVYLGSEQISLRFRPQAGDGNSLPFDFNSSETMEPSSPLTTKTAALVPVENETTAALAGRAPEVILQGGATLSPDQQLIRVSNTHDPTVSRKHLLFWLNTGGTLILHDLGSGTGTYLLEEDWNGLELGPASPTSGVEELKQLLRRADGPALRRPDPEASFQLGSAV